MVVDKVGLRELGHILVTHKVHNARCVGDDGIQRAIDLTLVILMGESCRGQRDEQSVLVEAEDGHRMDASSIGVGTARSHLHRVGSHHIEAKSHLVGTHRLSRRHNTSVVAIEQRITMTSSHKQSHRKQDSYIENSSHSQSVFCLLTLINRHRECNG